MFRTQGIINAEIHHIRHFQAVSLERFDPSLGGSEVSGYRYIRVARQNPIVEPVAESLHGFWQKRTDDGFDNDDPSSMRGEPRYFRIRIFAMMQNRKDRGRVESGIAQ